MIKAKLGRMRKPQEFTVYPKSKNDNGLIIVQSDRAIGQFDPTTGDGILNIKGSGFGHLRYGAYGAVAYQFPGAFVAQCIEAQLKRGDLIGASPITGPVYVA